MFQDIHRQLHHQITSCGVDITGLKDPSLNIVDTIVLAWQRINPAILRMCVIQRFTGTYCHSVILSEHEVDITQITFVFLHRLDGTLLGPVTLQGSNKGNTWIMTECFYKTVMTFLCRGRTLQAPNLQHTTFAIQLGGDILSHELTHLEVIRSDISCEFFRGCLPVEDDHRDTHIISPVDSRCYGSHLVRGNNQQIHLLFHELVDLLHLELVIIIGRDQFQVNVII